MSIYKHNIFPNKALVISQDQIFNIKKKTFRERLVLLYSIAV